MGLDPKTQTTLRRSRSALLALALIALGGCGDGGGEHSSPAPLISGARPAPIPAAQLSAASTAARRFGEAYARTIYQRNPPPLPEASAGAQRSIRVAARRVPPARRGWSPHAAAVQVEPESAGRLHAAVTIADGHSPPFSVGFLIERRGSSWRITSISPPG
jgi:hypothetical protein